MARTLTAIDMPAPRAKPSGRMVASPMAPLPKMEPEEGEREVAAEPKLMRDVLLYLEPREALDGKQYFGLCGSCRNYVSEGAMHGAVRGDRCALFGADFPVTDDSSCHLFCPTPDGQPCAHCQEHAGQKMIMGQRPCISPFVAGFVHDTTPRCARCRQYDPVESKCCLMEALNKALPEVYALDAAVKPGGRCVQWSDFPPPDEAMPT
jgi:hypothetical protein